MCGDLLWIYVAVVHALYRVCALLIAHVVWDLVWLREEFPVTSTHPLHYTQTHTHKHTHIHTHTHTTQMCFSLQMLKARQERLGVMCP